MKPEEPREPENESQPEPDREKDFTRRGLIQAGWTLPVILAIALPDSALALPGSGLGTPGGPGRHTNVPFRNRPATVIRHGDSYQFHRNNKLPFGIHDNVNYGEHTNIPETKIPHSNDPHVDVPPGGK
ncbi:MAG TPA: hypothetical protein VIW92_01570 [Thermoanaerobaculia bacterium]